MNTVLRNTVAFIIALLFAASGTAQDLKIQTIMQQDQVSVLIPFMPGSCHQCNHEFYKNLQALDAKQINYSYVIPDNYSDDLDAIKKKYRLEGYKNEQFIFSSALFDKYHIYEHAFVIQFGPDSNYKVYNNAKALISDLEMLNKEERVYLGNYKLKKSTFGLWVKTKKQFYIKSIMQTNAFEYLDLKDNKQVLTIPMTEEQLLYIYRLHFKDEAFAKSKLEEVQQVTDIPDKNRFEHFQFVQDSLYVSSHHTYIASMKDSTLGGFSAINIYKNGHYITSRAIDPEGLPPGYSIIPRFQLYNNAMYILIVKSRLEADKPNYFLAKFMLKDEAYQFEKMLPFKVPAINKNVGYRYIDLSFSGRYLMTSISNTLYDLETEQSVDLNIPVNKVYEFSHLLNNDKGIDIIVNDIVAQYPNLLISYNSTDLNGTVTNIILNYNLENKMIVGKVQMPMDDSRFLNPDLSRFGYFLWMPEKDKSDYFIYKKLF